MFIKHETTKIPSNVRKMAIKFIIIDIIFSIINKALAFSLQLGKDQIVAGHIILGLIFIGTYFVRDTFSGFSRILFDNIKVTFDEAQNLSLSEISIKVFFKTRGKVWVRNEENGSSEIMTASRLQDSCRKYLNKLWDFKIYSITHIADIIVLIVSFVGFIKISYSEIKNSFAFIAIVIFTSVISLLTTFIRSKLNDNFRKSDKKIDQKKKEIFNDILNIEPLNNEHSKYMISNYYAVSKKSFDNVRTRNFNTNKLTGVEHTICALSVIALIAVKVYEVGLENINLEVVLSLISILTIYLSTQHSFSDIARSISGAIDSYKEIKNYEKDFSKILEIYDKENQPEDEFFAYLSEIDVPKFEVQYPVLNSETPFLLKNPTDLTFKSGDIVLFVGPTGSGKSTLLKLVTNYMKFDSFKLNFKKCTNGRIGTVLHQTDGRIGCNDVLSEITLGKRVDTDKLFRILKGIHLYEEISEKDMDVTRYLSTSKINNYSTGQKQRLAIARLLYNLNDDIQIIAFDEATNALNDEITLQTLGFIKQFCKDKILFIATHQVDIGETVANKIIQFVPAGTHYEIKQTQ